METFHDPFLNVPSMNEGRLKTVSNITNIKRKHMSIVNDQVKLRCLRLQKRVDRDIALDMVRFQRATVPYKRALVEIRGMQKCLKNKASNGDHSIMGRYGGIELDSLKKEVDSLIAYGHPRLRRIRRIEKLLRDGEEDGRLLKNEDVKHKLDTFLFRSKDLFPSEEEEEPNYTKIHGVSDLLKPVKRNSSRFILPPIGVNKSLIQQTINK